MIIIKVMTDNNVQPNFVAKYLTQLVNEETDDRLELEESLLKLRKQRKNLIEKGRKQEERMKKLVKEMNATARKILTTDNSIEDLKKRIVNNKEEL